MTKKTRKKNPKLPPKLSLLLLELWSRRDPCGRSNRNRRRKLQSLLRHRPLTRPILLPNPMAKLRPRSDGNPESHEFEENEKLTPEEAEGGETASLGRAIANLAKERVNADLVEKERVSANPVEKERVSANPVKEKASANPVKEKASANLAEKERVSAGTMANGESDVSPQKSASKWSPPLLPKKTRLKWVRLLRTSTERAGRQ